MAESFQPAAVLVRASRAYVNENGRDEFPYDTVEKGSPSISTVLHSLGVGSTLYVAEGRYVISNGISLVDDGCTRIESLVGRPALILCAWLLERPQKSIEDAISQAMQSV